MLHICGRHGIAVSSSHHLVGNFNAHLRDCICLFCDEAGLADDKAAHSRLKALITEPFLMIEAKNRDAIQAPNFTHIIMASNDAWVIPASLGARRFFVLDVSRERLHSHI